MLPARRVDHRRYTPYEFRQYYKWKWPELATVDLRVDQGPEIDELSGLDENGRSHPRLHFSCGGTANTDINLDEQLSVRRAQERDEEARAVLSPASLSHTPYLVARLTRDVNPLPSLRGTRPTIDRSARRYEGGYKDRSSGMLYRGGKLLLDAKNLAELRGEFARASTQNASMVCEFAYNSRTGRWTYLHARHDKTRANYITSVIDACVQLAEGIGEDELQ